MTKILLIAIQMLMLAHYASAQSVPAPLGHGYEFDNNGKVPGVEFSQMYIKGAPAYGELRVTPGLREAAQRNARYVSRIAADKSFAAGNLQVTGEQLIKAAEIIGHFSMYNQTEALQQLAFHQIEGEDGRGNVHFTGYFTPRLAARSKRDDVFKYPIYGMPKLGRMPTRKEIDHDKALAGRGLELAYTDSLLDNFFLSVQGSGVLDFGDGNIRHIGFAGANGHPYRSVGKMLVANGSIPAEKISLRTIRAWFSAHPEQLVPTLNNNPSYTFFEWRPAATTGGAGVPLTAMHSIAVDRSCIPYGACLLAEIPVLDEHRGLTGHRYDILFAHDTGGAIKGPGHIDLYHGQGREAGDNAGDLHHYGRLWLLLAE
ncbi:MAG: Membrane-bound lytic murein transglycosylase A [Candidatus Rifleibacterium amylolyticum]|nr:MAG: Membrane-bound lytic murein transglycosylase A [Candidatus Rifleibacterium amylolyticum]